MIARYLLLSMLDLFFLVGCRKPCREPDRLFSINSNFLDEKESINVGDTLWLSCETSTTMTDKNRQTNIDFRNAENMATALHVADVAKFSSLQRGAIDSFGFIKITGDIYTDENLDPAGTKQIFFLEADSKYQFKVGIIAKKTGTYIFSIADIPTVFIKNKGKCGKASVEILNNNNNKHLYLFENVWGQLSTHDSAHSYCFKVK
jgi:hypothetical protein